MTNGSECNDCHTATWCQYLQLCLSENCAPPATVLTEAQKDMVIGSFQAWVKDLLEQVEDLTRRVEAGWYSIVTLTAERDQRMDALNQIAVDQLTADQLAARLIHNLIPNTSQLPHVNSEGCWCGPVLSAADVTTVRFNPNLFPPSSK